MLIAEYDYDTDIAVKREEAWEDGHEAGLEQGLEQSIIKSASKKLEYGILDQELTDDLIDLFEIDSTHAKIIIDKAKEAINK